MFIAMNNNVNYNTTTANIAAHVCVYVFFTILRSRSFFSYDFFFIRFFLQLFDDTQACVWRGASTRLKHASMFSLEKLYLHAIIVNHSAVDVIKKIAKKTVNYTLLFVCYTLNVIIQKHTFAKYDCGDIQRVSRMFFFFFFSKTMVWRSNVHMVFTDNSSIYLYYCACFYTVYCSVYYWAGYLSLWYSCVSFESVAIIEGTLLDVN